jgi:hypothetical protein
MSVQIKYNSFGYYSFGCISVKYNVERDAAAKGELNMHLVVVVVVVIVVGVCWCSKEQVQLVNKLVRIMVNLDFEDEASE